MEVISIEATTFEEIKQALSSIIRDIRTGRGIRQEEKMCIRDSYETVHSVKAADYTEEQLDAWATGNVDLAAWDKSFLEHFTIVAEEPGDDGKKIVGFGDIDSRGYLDRLYVQKDYQRRGIASAICDELEMCIRDRIMGWKGYHLFSFEFQDYRIRVEELDEDYDDPYYELEEASETLIDPYMENTKWFTYS